MKNTLLFVWEVGKIILISLLIVVPIRYFLFEPFFVRGVSMEPNFQSGDYLIVDRISYRFRDPQRGEVVVFKHSGNSFQHYIKRIVGLSGERIKIKDGQVIVFGHGQQEGKVLDELDYLASNIQTLGGERKIFLAENEFFVLGDNRIASSDSRHWGSLSRKNIIGRVFFRPWPITAFAKIEAPEYE